MELTRRDLLATFLGCPFAAAACRTRAPELPPGTLVGASHEVGHRLRHGPPPEPARWESHDVVIVGAGIAGLAAAWRLAAAGVRDVVVFELEPAPGGTSRSTNNYPWGAHYVIAPSAEDRVTARLLGEMGVMEGDAVAEQFLCRDPQERLFHHGRWYEGLYLHAGASHEDLRQLRAFEAEISRWSAWRDARGRRAFTIPASRASDDAEVTALDRLSMADWLDARGFTSPRLRWYVDYACRDDYGSRLHDTSAWAGIFYFASRDERTTVTWPEGNGRIVGHLARFASVRTGWLVADIAPAVAAAGRAADIASVAAPAGGGAAVAPDVAPARGGGGGVPVVAAGQGGAEAAGADVIAVRGDEVVGIRAKRVIFAGPQFVAARVIRPWREHPPAHVREFEYGSWLVANLALRDRPSSHGFPLAWDNVLYDSPSLGYVVATHQRGPDRGPTVLTYYYPLTGNNARMERERLLSAGRDQWADVALTDLSRAHPDLRTLTTQIDIMRWGHAMIRPRPNFVWSQARLTASHPVGPIHFAHTDLSAVALCEEALDHGVRAAEEVMGGMGVHVSRWRG